MRYITLFFSLWFSHALFAQAPLPKVVNQPQADIIFYQYYYTSIIVLDESVDKDEKRDWYFTYREQVDSCLKNFVYPEDFNASTIQAKDSYKKECLYQTIVDINNFENNLYFEGKKINYNLYNTNPIFANMLEDTLSCENCSLYPNRNSDIIYITSNLVPNQKIRSFTLNENQQEIFTHIFNLTKDKIRTINTNKETIIRWINKINAAKNRTQLKLVWDDFVNHIEFSPLETKAQIIQIGEKIYQESQKPQE